MSDIRDGKTQSGAHYKAFITNRGNVSCKTNAKYADQRRDVALMMVRLFGSRKVIYSAWN